MTDQILRDTHIKDVRARFDMSQKRRDAWLSIWEECYEYALPHRGEIYADGMLGEAQHTHLFDGTAMDAVDQLAASLLAELCPPWGAWFGLKPGTALSEQEAAAIAPKLEHATRVMQDHFDRSNFAVELHQAFLDLVTAGTASLYMKEEEPGKFSALRFTSIPLNQIVLEQGADGLLSGSYRLSEMTAEHIAQTFPRTALPDDFDMQMDRNPQAKIKLLEAVLPQGLNYVHSIIMLADPEPVLLQQKTLQHSPFINFRWMKSPGEIYGRSPVMKALPDIKTANKVVELILKNASIAVTGIWQADDDGVLNPANIALKPGTIIPKAVGSSGLTPLDMPSNFDLSDLVLSDLRARIRHALLADRMDKIDRRQMTATEVMERSSEMSRILGATYGRLQTELLTPLIKRAYAILRERGEIPDLALDGRYVSIEYRSPLARQQASQNVGNIVQWVTMAGQMGAGASEAVNISDTVRYLGEALGVPSQLIRRDFPILTDMNEVPHAQTF